MKKYKYSLIVPTFNSEFFISIILKSISNLDYPKDKIEVIIADNMSTDKTKQIALNYKCKFVSIKGKAPQVCLQRNVGAEISSGDYILFIDVDMEFPKNFFQVTSKNISDNPSVDAWIIPEKIIAHDPLLTKARNFENFCALDSVVPSFRLMKRKAFFRTNKYDLKLSSGPADWDMDIQLRRTGIKFKTLDTFIIHHEERLTMWKYVTKKANYVKGIDIYKEKWLKKDPGMYNNIILKQLSPIYRSFGIYYENGKWKNTLKNFFIYVFLIFLTLLKGSQYYLKLNKFYGK